MIPPGTRLGACLVQEPVGGGGMGVVYRAWDPVAQLPLAVKALNPHLAARPQIRERFLLATALLAWMDHPNIIRVHDVFEKGDILAALMELVEGPDLDQVIRDERPGVPWSLFETFAVMGPVLSAMAYAHAHRVVHRDLKPGNILLARNVPGARWPGDPKIIDFDLVKFEERRDPRPARAGGVMGTFLYMAPEQFRGEREVDSRADVFALGMMIYQLLAGRLPVERPDDPQSAVDLYQGRTQIPPLTRLAPDVPPPIAGLVHRALSLSQDDRPPTAGWLLEAILGHWRPEWPDLVPDVGPTPAGRVSVVTAPVSFGSLASDPPPLELPAPELPPQVVVGSPFLQAAPHGSLLAWGGLVFGLLALVLVLVLVLAAG